MNDEDEQALRDFGALLYKRSWADFNPVLRRSDFRDFAEDSDARIALIAREIVTGWDEEEEEGD